MDLQKRLRQFLNDFCTDRGISEVPSVGILKRSVKDTSTKADCRIFLGGKSFHSFEEHLEHFTEQLLKSSESWPVPVVKCWLHPPSYLEVQMSKPIAFRSHMKLFLQERCVVEGCLGDKVALVFIPYVDPSFTFLRTERLSAYAAMCYSNEGLSTNVYFPEHGATKRQHDAVKCLSCHDQCHSISPAAVWCLLQRLPYYDESKAAVNLNKYLLTRDKRTASGYDQNIGYVSLNSSAFRTALLLAHIIEDHLREPPDIVLYVAPYCRSYVTQQSGLLFELIFPELFPDSTKSPKQQYLFHNSVVAEGSDSREQYASRVKAHLSKAFFHRCNPNVEKGELMSSVDSLAMSKVTFEVLGSKQSARASIRKVEDYEGKGGLFVQYTSARLSALLAKYDAEVQNGKYPALCPMDEADFSCLDSDLEWKLWHSLDACHWLLENNRLPSTEVGVRVEVNSQRLCEEAVALCSAFSAYYSKMRVLVEPREHLMKMLMARLWLVKAVQKTLHRMMQRLDLSPLDRM